MSFHLRVLISTFESQSNVRPTLQFDCCFSSVRVSTSSFPNENGSLCKLNQQEIQLPTFYVVTEISGRTSKLSG